MTLSGGIFDGVVSEAYKKKTGNTPKLEDEGRKIRRDVPNHNTACMAYGGLASKSKGVGNWEIAAVDFTGTGNERRGE